jgi:membrane-bound lytic murein transglycosylase F
MPTGVPRTWTLLLAIALCASCAPRESLLDAIRARGELRVATRNSPTTYYLHRDGETGLEYEMARLFAQRLKVRLRIVLAGDRQGVVDLVRDGKADIAAAALRHRYVAESGLLPGPDYQWVTPQVIYRNGRRAPRNLADLFPDQLHLLPASLPAPVLADIQVRYPQLSIYVHRDLQTADLLDMVEHGRIAFTVLPSNEVFHVRQLRPELRAAFAVGEPEPLAWGLPRSEDRSLSDAVAAFFTDLQRSGRLGELLAHFQAPVESFDYMDSRAFLQRLDSRLPLYRDLFERIADETGLDWRFLAAIAYQESHWEPGARSPTGVRGLMMLTRDTATRLGVRDRLDVKQSLRGGARYFLELRARLPQRIPEPDRTWMALAAYNVGLGHLEDARVLTERQGRDPDNWLEVREHLPLLSSERWYTQTRHGYARGFEPVRYVRNIRRYYHVLLQLTQPEPPAQEWLVEMPGLDLPIM